MGRAGQTLILQVCVIFYENANAYFNRGCCYDSIGEIDLAISDYSVALELDMKASAQNPSNSTTPNNERLNNEGGASHQF